MRSNDIKSSATKSSKPIKSRLRLSLAMTAIAMVFVLASGADAAQRVGSSEGSGGRMASNTGSVDQGGGGGVRDGRQIARRTAIAVRPASERRYVRDEVLIQVASSVPNETIVALGRRLRLDRAASFTDHNIPPSVGRFSTGARCRRSSARSKPNPSSWRRIPITPTSWNRRNRPGLARPAGRALAHPALFNLDGPNPANSPRAKGVDRDDLFEAGGTFPGVRRPGGASGRGRFCPSLPGKSCSEPATPGRRRNHCFRRPRRQQIEIACVFLRLRAPAARWQQAKNFCANF